MNKNQNEQLIDCMMLAFFEEGMKPSEIRQECEIRLGINNNK